MHKYEMIATGAGFKVLNDGVETTVINQDGTLNGSSVIDDGSVTAAKLDTNAVTTVKIEDAAVTSAKLDETLVQYATVEVSAAEIVLLNSAPKELVAAPGANKVVELLSAVISYDYDTAAYTTNGDLTIQTGTTSTAQSDTVAGNDLLLGGASVIRAVQPLSADTVMDANESLVLAVGTGEAVNPGTAAGTLTVKVTYRIHDFS